MKIVIAIPAYNEEKMLRSTVSTLVMYCQELPDEYEIIVADNNSSDATGKIAAELAQKYETVSAITVTEQGKGAAVFSAWEAATADIYCFMDADLATDLNALPLLVDALKSGADIAIGSRFHPQSIVERSALRKLTSWLYRLLLKLVFQLPIADVPCGFKAVTREVVTILVPSVEDRGWFFDSEFLVRAVRLGYRVAEVPVTWRELRDADDASRVNVVKLGKAYSAKVFRLFKQLRNI